MNNSKIDLFDLIRKILHQWKFILIIMLVCGLVFEGIGYARAYMEYRQEINGTAKEDEETADEYQQAMEDAKADLTEREIFEAEIAAAAYSSYREQYQKELIYCQNAVKMQLDANHVPTYIMHYAITSPEADMEVVNHAAASVSELVINEETCEEIRETLGWDTEPGYIKELIEVETEEKVDNSVTVVVDADMGKQATIQIQAPTREESQSIAEIIKNHIAQETANLQDRYGAFEMSLLTESYLEEADDDLRSFQDNRYVALNTLRSAIGSLPSNMTEDQQDYYYAIIAYNMLTDDSDILISEEEETEKTVSASAPEIIRWKFILLGLFLGLVLACGYIFLRYILAKNLRVKDDLEEMYHIPTLGYISINGKKQRFTQEERMEMICAGIRIAIQKADLKNVYLTGTAGDGESQQIMEQMETALADSGAQISSGRDAACDPASLEQMTASDGVVFVERVDRSPYADIQKEVELCQMYNVPVIGSVVIE